MNDRGRTGRQGRKGLEQPRMIGVLAFGETIVPFRVFRGGGNHIEIKSRSKPVDEDVWDRQTLRALQAEPATIFTWGAWPVSL